MLAPPHASLSRAVNNTATIPAHNHESNKKNAEDDVGRTFDQRQRDHFEGLLKEKWTCQLFREDHTVCVPTEDGQHFTLSEHHIQQWVDALCNGKATTASPPKSVFEELPGGKFNRKTGEPSVRAVSVAPSRSRHLSHHPPIDHRAGSIDSTSDSASTSVSSGGPGPGYIGAMVIDWLGEKGLMTIRGTMILGRTKRYTSRLQRWARVRIELGDAVRDKVLEMLQDALDMCWTCCSVKVNNRGFAIGRAIHYWLYSCRDVPQDHETLRWLIQVQVSLVPILLTRVSRVDPLAGDLAYRTLVAVKGVSLDEQCKRPLDEEGEDTWATVITLIAHELAYAKCTFQHSWLGIVLVRIVEMRLRVRSLWLRETEIKSIKELAVRREKQHAKQEVIWRPWEVALFALCVPQDACFKDIVLAPHGLRNLVSALDSMLSEDKMVDQIHWENVAITLRALAFLSEKKWVADSVDSEIVKSLLQVFRRSIPQRWFCIRFWAADTICNMVAHRGELARHLDPKAVSAFSTLSNHKLDLELSTNRLEPGYLRENCLQVPPVLPTPPTPTLSATTHSDILSSTSDSPPHTPKLPLSPLSTDKPQYSCPSSPVSVPLSPITPPPGQGDSHSSIWPLPSLPSIRFPASGIRHDRRSSTGSSDVTPPVQPRVVFRDNGFSQSLPTLPNPRPPPSLVPTPTQERLLKDYKDVAAKRAMKLLEYVSKWNGYTPDALPTLEASGAGVGWLSSWEAEGWIIDDRVES